VKTAQTTIPDSVDSVTALTDLQSNAAVAALRNQYGADVVAMAESTVGGCRGAEIQLGANLTPISPGPSGPAYLVWGDDGTGTCDPGIPGYGLASSLGSTFGLAMQPGVPYEQPGAYTFSYAYQKSGTSKPAQGTLEIGGFAIWPYFSNPNLNLCDAGPCGVSNVSDAARSLNLVLPIIATFAPTMVVIHNDIDGDGESDLLWYSASAHRMSYWVMSGATMTSWQGFDVPVGYQPIGTGDFDGDGHADILWKSASGGLYMWLSKGSSFTSQYVGAYPAGGWVLAGTADINNDGKADLIWYNPTMGRVSYWLMDGATMTAWQGIWTNTGLKALATGNFDGNADSDIIWLTPNGTMVMWIFNSSGNFNYYNMGQYPGGDWEFAGTGDVNGDGKTDLFWYSPSAGLMAYWLMNGPTVTSSQGFWTYTGMMPLATGTFDGSNAGLTWKGSSGQMYMWLFNIFNGSALNYYSMGAYPPDGYVPIP